jgi:limonene-1,2-epoxide hydrolase
MKQPEKVVRAELQAWSSLDVDQIMSHFAPDAVWDNGPTYGTASGQQEIRKAVEGFLNGMTNAEIAILYLAVVHNVVLTERVDRFILNGKATETRIMGTFEIAGDKIAAWRDYFDPADHD